MLDSNAEIATSSRVLGTPRNDILACVAPTNLFVGIIKRQFDPQNLKFTKVLFITI